MSNDLGKVLILESDQSIIFSAKMALKPHFSQVQTESNSDILKQHLEDNHFDVIVLDMNYAFGLSAGTESLKLLRQILAQDPNAHILITTSYDNIELATLGLTLGAIDFLVKPCPKEKLLASVKAIYQLSISNKQKRHYRYALNRLAEVQHPRLYDPPFKSKAMKDLIEKAEAFGKSHQHVLIEGPDGTDKETIARTVYNYSNRTEQPCIPLDLRKVNPEDHENILFGYTKGINEPGFIEVCSEGFIFLQGIEMLSPPILTKLLATIQNKEIRVTKSDQSISINTRFICSTSVSLTDRLEKKPELAEFLAQAEFDTLQIIALNERPDDIIPLLKYYLKNLGEGIGHKKVDISAQISEFLSNHSWPKNEMQLKNAAERALMVCSSSLLLSEDFGIYSKF